MVTQTHKLSLILKYGIIYHIPKEKVLQQFPTMTCPITHEVYGFKLKGKYQNLPSVSIMGIQQPVKPDEIHKFITLVYNNIIKDIEP